MNKNVIQNRVNFLYESCDKLKDMIFEDEKGAPKILGDLYEQYAEELLFLSKTHGIYYKGQRRAA